MKHTNQGLVIAFDGPDCAGKTTQLELASNHLKSKGYTVSLARHSGGTPIGEKLREVSLSDTPRSAETDVYISMAMGVALADMLDKTRSSGNVCLIDRSPLALLAYNGYGSQFTDIKKAEDFVRELLMREKIDLLIMFTANQEVLNQRMQDRPDTKDYFEKQGKDFFTRVQSGYEIGLEIIKEDPGLVQSIVEIDATPSVELVKEEVLKSIDNYIDQ